VPEMPSARSYKPTRRVPAEPQYSTSGVSGLSLPQDPGPQDSLGYEFAPPSNQASPLWSLAVKLIVFAAVVTVSWVYRFELLHLLRIVGHGTAWALIIIVVLVMSYLALHVVRKLSKLGWKQAARLSGLFFGALIMYLVINICAVPLCDGKIDQTLMELSPAGQRVVYARKRDDYELLALPTERRIRADELRESALMLAVTPIEDERFWTRPTGPIDAGALLRAAVQTFVKGKKQGGSTILIQTAKLIQGKFQSSYGDKPQQFLMALRLSQRFPTGEEQLALYLNLAEIAGHRGIGYAAADLLGVSDLRELKSGDVQAILSSALLAGMLNAPTKYNPRRYPQEALKRRNVVLEKMAQAGVVKDLVALKALPIILREADRVKDYSFFAQAMKKERV